MVYVFLKCTEKDRDTEGQNNHDGKKKLKDQEMGTNSTVGMKRWKERKMIG